MLHAAISKLNDIVLIAEVGEDTLKESKVIFVNDAFEKKTGYKKSELVGKSSDLLQSEHITIRERIEIRDSLKQGKAVRKQLLNYMKDGRERWFDLDIVPIIDQDGNYTHWVAVERDITEQKQLEAQLNHAQRLESIGFLTGGIAHDFNNLLTVFTGTTEMLVEELEDEPALKEIAETALIAADRGKNLTSSLLAFARKQSLKPTTFAVDEFIESLMPLVKSSLGQNIIIEVDNQAIHLIKADRAQLENTLLNLMVNAKDAMPGGGKVNINIDDLFVEPQEGADSLPLETGQFTRVAVTDTGIGISDEVKEHMFDPFFSTKSKGKGTGLGLSTAYGFIKQSKGHIKVDSALGKGTTMTIYLPSVPEGKRYDKSIQQHNPPVLKGRKILTVEDDPEVLSFVSNRLRTSGYAVTEAANGEAALELLNGQETFDLLFSDIVMPGSIDGVQLAKLARQVRPSMPILLTSGFNDYHNEDSDSAKLAYPLLAKPYQKHELLEKVYQTLNDMEAVAKW